MTLAKFAELLRSKSVFFCSLANLAKNDPKEGLFSKVDQALYSRSISEFSETERQQFNIRNEEQWNAVRRNMLQVLEWATPARHQFAVSCWHARDHEDYAMWNIYAKESGMCIKTDLARLVRAFEKYTDDKVYIGKVRYIDFETQMVGASWSFSPSVTKRREFSYESEVRAVINRVHSWKDNDGKGYFDPLSEPIGAGLAVPVDLVSLLSEVYVSPYAESFLLDTVTDLLRRHDLSVPVLRSAI